MEIKEKPLHTLATIEDFKALMGADDREDRQARFCLVTATLNIEHYCRRKFLRKQYFETVKIGNNLVLPLRADNHYHLCYTAST